MKRNPPKEQGIFETLREDVRQGEHVRTIKREYRDIREFYINEQRRELLKQKSWILRPFIIGWWLLKGMFYHLSPTRRLLIVAGLVFSANGLTVRAGDVLFKDNGFVGFAMILFVLILELKDKILARDELESGRLIQRALMPDSCPRLDGWEIWFDYQPAREVGGDLVDCLFLNDDRCAIMLADVAGKGLRAALLAAKLQATVRAIATDHNDLAHLCSRINSIFHRDSLKTIFASLLYAEVRSGQAALSYVNAGHMPPFVHSADGVRELPKGQIALGLSSNAAYATQRLDLQPGDVFFAFTDGLSEATNEGGQLYGTERIRQNLSSWRHHSAETIIQNFRLDVQRFIQETPARDDMSLLVIKRV